MEDTTINQTKPSKKDDSLRNNSAKKNLEQYESLLSYLIDNETKLRILLSGDQKIAPLLYPIKGKRSTKTVFISDKLQCLINEYCIDKELKIGDLIECAIIQYLNQNGYSEKLEEILNNVDVLSQ